MYINVTYNLHFLSELFNVGIKAVLSVSIIHRKWKGQCAIFVKDEKKDLSLIYIFSIFFLYKFSV